MNKTPRILRILALMMCMMMTASIFPAPSFALSKGTVYINSTTAKVYKKKSTSSASLGTLSFGQTVRCTAVSGSWATVKNSSGATGYMKTNTLTQTNPNTYKKTVYIQKNGLKVYAHASTASKKMASLKAGAKYTAVAKSGKWLRIKNGKYYGYVQADYTGSSYDKGTKVYMNERLITVTSAPQAFDSIGSLSLGQSCYLLEKTNRYAKVRSAGGRIGYINDPSVLTNKNPNTLNKTMYVQASSMPYYPNAIIENAKGTLKKNTPVTVVAQCKQGWYRVKIKGKYYYMPEIVLDSSKAPSGGRVYYANDLCDWLYEKPNLSAKKVAPVKEGDKLILLGCKGSGLKVKNADGKIGYVLTTEIRR